MTTSLAKKKDWFFEPSKGWNLTEFSLGKWFSIKIGETIPYDEYYERIRNSSVLLKRLNPFYRFSQQNGLPLGILKDAKYIPVGIRKRKSL